MKKICVITATRAEYGLLKWIMREIDRSNEFELQLIVTGAHLMNGQGHTVDLIIDDGFSIDREVDIGMDASSQTSIASSMGRMGEEFPAIFEDLMPDYILVLGDRYELLPICNSALVMRIPIIHISGGDITEGAIDDAIRNAITMMASYHFPGTKDSADNIIRMRNNEDNVWTVGEPGLDSLRLDVMLSREELAESLNLDINRKWVLFTYHPETRESLDNNMKAVRNCINALINFEGFLTIATYSNTDNGGECINRYLEEQAENNPNYIKVIPSLGNKRYLSMMKQVAFVMGNSSSGIVEAPSLGIPAINIGSRQKGRYLCSNVIQVDIADLTSVNEAINKVVLNPVDLSDTDHWGDGHTADKIIKIMKKVL